MTVIADNRLRAGEKMRCEPINDDFAIRGRVCTNSKEPWLHGYGTALFNQQCPRRARPDSSETSVP